MERNVAEWAQGKTASGYTDDPRIDCSDGSSGKAMVRKGGLEPPRPLGHQILSLARLPIPPLSRTALPIISSSDSPRACRHQRQAGNLPSLMLPEAWFYLACVSLDARTGPSTTLGTNEQQFPRPKRHQYVVSCPSLGTSGMTQSEGSGDKGQSPAQGTMPKTRTRMAATPLPRMMTSTLLMRLADSIA